MTIRTISIRGVPIHRYRLENEYRYRQKTGIGTSLISIKILVVKADIQ